MSSNQDSNVVVLLMGTIEMMWLNLSGPKLYSYGVAVWEGVSLKSLQAPVPHSVKYSPTFTSLNSILKIENAILWTKQPSSSLGHCDNRHTKQVLSSWTIFLTKPQTFILWFPQLAVFMELERTYSVRFCPRKRLWLVWSPQTTIIHSM